MTTTVMKSIDFCAGHRLVGHGGRCENLHGHNYRVEIYVEAERLDSIGCVVDFAYLRDLVKNWIDEHWDHGFILADFDENAIRALRSVQPNKLYLLSENPTAENMARHLLDELGPVIAAEPSYQARQVRISKMMLWETDSSCAEILADSPEPPVRGGPMVSEMSR